jgi:hypothetical protein
MSSIHYKCDWCDYESTNEDTILSHEKICACNPINQRKLEFNNLIQDIRLAQVIAAETVVINRLKSLGLKL